MNWSKCQYHRKRPDQRQGTTSVPDRDTQQVSLSVRATLYDRVQSARTHDDGSRIPDQCHSRALADTNSNYGNVLSVYDQLLGTFTPSERAYSVVYGLDDADPAESASFPGLLAMPFEAADEVAVPDTKVR